MWLLIALPLAGATVLLLGGRRTDAWGHLLGVGASAGSFVVGAVLFFSMLGKGPDEHAFRQHLFDWVSVGGFQADVALHLDQLSICFVLLITGVGSLIHV